MRMDNPHSPHPTTASLTHQRATTHADVEGEEEKETVEEGKVEGAREGSVHGQSRRTLSRTV